MLLDDVLSAVDAHVGAHIFEACVLGLLARRTRVLVTHAVPLTVMAADQVVVMHAGRVLAAGPPTSPAPEILALVAQAGLADSKLLLVDAARDTPDEMAAALQQAACIFVLGGNTFYLWHHMRTSGLSELIRRRVVDDGAADCGCLCLATGDGEDDQARGGVPSKSLRGLMDKASPS